jgi:hypothetical protein
VVQQPVTTQVAYLPVPVAVAPVVNHTTVPGPPGAPGPPGPPGSPVPGVAPLL